MRIKPERLLNVSERNGPDGLTVEAFATLRVYRGARLDELPQDVLGQHLRQNLPASEREIKVGGFYAPGEIGSGVIVIETQGGGDVSFRSLGGLPEERLNVRISLTVTNRHGQAEQRYAAITKLRTVLHILATSPADVDWPTAVPI